MKYEYLKQFINPSKTEKITNWFYPVEEGEIQTTERDLQINFPSQLRNFYQEIGYGSLNTPCKAKEDYIFYSSNLILPPSLISEIFEDPLNNEYMDYSTYELLEPGDLPFFEIGDSSNFLVMKLNSDNPNTIWTDGSPIKIADSFEEFIWRLYYESPSFYGDIIEEYLKKKDSS